MTQIPRHLIQHLYWNYCTQLLWMYSASCANFVIRQLVCQIPLFSMCTARDLRDPASVADNYDSVNYLASCASVIRHMYCTRLLWFSILYFRDSASVLYNTSVIQHPVLYKTSMIQHPDCYFHDLASAIDCHHSASAPDFQGSECVLYVLNSVIRHPVHAYQPYVSQHLYSSRPTWFTICSRLMSFSNFTVCEIRESAAVQIAIYVIQDF